MAAATTKRVSQQTSPESNERIRHKTEMNIAYYTRYPTEIPKRLRELDEEWDIERLLETGSSSITLGSLLLALTRGKKWLIVSIAVQAFLLQHAIEGWCPPLPVFRRMGIRTADEIDRERYTLKAVLEGGSQQH